MPETVSFAHQRHGSSIGQPITRRDGPDKVTGAARYTADVRPEGLLHAVMAVSTIAKGRVAHLDVAAAEGHPGVVAVMTPKNAPTLAKSPDEKDNPFAFRLDLLQGDHVRYAGQPIAVVIAETLEAATEGAALLAPRYVSETPVIALGEGDLLTPPAVGAGSPTSEGTGDLEDGLAVADSRLTATYETAAQYHNALEPHSSVAEWDGDRLTLYTPSQALWIAKARLAGFFGIPPENIRVICHYLGGGFGSKGFLSPPQILGVMASKLVGRPVKLVTRREQMFGPVGHRAPTRQTLTLGATRDGALTAFGHHTLTQTSSYDDFYEACGLIARHLYASPAISTTHEGTRADIGTPIFMRAPGEAPGSVAVESALDELALELDLDPLELRLKNYAEVEPITGRPFSSKALRECYAQGAERFGWAKRPKAPRQLRDADGLLIGWGMGTATYPAGMMQGEARATIHADGTALIETSAQDMGQGSWTVLAQIGADGLGLPAERVTLRIGDTDLPNGGLAGGSTGTATGGMAVHNAASSAIAGLAGLATNDPASPLYGAGNAGVTARDGRLVRNDDPTRSESFGEILARAGRSSIEAKGQGAGEPASRKAYAMHAHGAVYAEVKVDPDLGQIRVTRLVGAFAAGRVINPRLVRSQYYGGMIWGVSLALHEHAVHDLRSGRIMNANLAEYHVPVNADIPSVEAILVEEHDPHVNPLGIKGVGEIGITGTAGAIANAVWHATGVRVREIPITLDKLLG
ncbi:MAG: xanthine dehydrogenase family protein molybdopterin-binding subunit [Methylobacterium sp.]|uniref:xanthine dehydrogenase family protein molybdopterin-binding subunit n=1 Tax=Methylobacterium sp. TaxID=409 RepID=UPI0025D259B2|nr:xanthine dehydrogenase family protein molybdopterin-binding subunit [Methylobacterium sp.]MBX9931120.1 xanthine dehydrogenase family protein molybdopterin-binding subunit [Methylobacterium sp.]